MPSLLNVGFRQKRLFRTTPNRAVMRNALQCYYDAFDATNVGIDRESGYHLTNNNVVTQVAGLRGYAANLVGASSQSLSITDAAANQKHRGGQSFTYICWFNENAATGNAFLFAKDNTTVGDYYLQVPSGTSLSFLVRSVDGGTHTVGSGGGTVTAAKWNMAAVTYDAGEWLVGIRINARSPVFNRGTAVGSATTQAFRVGGNNNTTSGYDGLMFPLIRFNRVLDSYELNWEHAGGVGRTYSDHEQWSRFQVLAWNSLDRLRRKRPTRPLPRPALDWLPGGVMERGIPHIRREVWRPCYR